MRHDRPPHPVAYIPEEISNSDAKGYYSVIQFSPDPARAEAVNVGVLLFCPARGFIAAKTRRDNQRVRRMFGDDGFENDRLNAAKTSMERRVARLESAGLEDLERFIASRGNDIILTPARSIRVTGDPAELLGELHEERVGSVEREKSGPSMPELDQAMHSPTLHDRIRFNQDVEVPRFGRTLRIPYAYQNGTFNRIKPQVFKNAPIERASFLALSGRVIREHKDPEHGEQRLIVVSDVADRAHRDKIRETIDNVFDEANVRNVWRDELPRFLEEVEAELDAHD